jgi:hypothetical protein
MELIQELQLTFGGQGEKTGKKTFYLAVKSAMMVAEFIYGILFCQKDSIC